jgi:hypothetical protein
MDEFTTELQCALCQGRFHVELRTMRLGVRNTCPSCGFDYEVSGDQAIKAHRFLEELEHLNRANHIRPNTEAGFALLSTPY